MTRCPNCDRPVIEDDSDHPGGCECADCMAVCWRRHNGDVCVGEPVDWPARCRAAESALATARRVAGEALDGWSGAEAVWRRLIDEADEPADPRIAALRAELEKP